LIRRYRQTRETLSFFLRLDIELSLLLDHKRAFPVIPHRLRALSLSISAEIGLSLVFSSDIVECLTTGIPSPRTRKEPVHPTHKDLLEERAPPLHCFYLDLLASESPFPPRRHLKPTSQLFEEEDAFSFARGHSFLFHSERRKLPPSMQKQKLLFSGRRTRCPPSSRTVFPLLQSHDESGEGAILFLRERGSFLRRDARSFFFQYGVAVSGLSHHDQRGRRPFFKNEGLERRLPRRPPTSPAAHAS